MRRTLKKMIRWTRKLLRGLYKKESSFFFNIGNKYNVKNIISPIRDGNVIFINKRLMFGVMNYDSGEVIIVPVYKSIVYIDGLYECRDIHDTVQIMNRYGVHVMYMGRDIELQWECVVKIDGVLFKISDEILNKKK